MLWSLWLSPLRDIPTVPVFPLWGQLFQLMSQEVGEPQREWHEQLGPIIRFFLSFC